MTASGKKTINYNNSNEGNDHISLHRRLRRMKRRLLFNCIENSTNGGMHDDTTGTSEVTKEASTLNVTSYDNPRSTMSVHRINGVLKDASNFHSTLPRD